MAQQSTGRARRRHAPIIFHSIARSLYNLPVPTWPSSDVRRTPRRWDEVNKDEQVRRNLDLAEEFLHEMVDHPELLDSIPDGTTVVLIPGTATPSLPTRTSRWPARCFVAVLTASIRIGLRTTSPVLVSRPRECTSSRCARSGPPSSPLRRPRRAASPRSRSRFQTPVELAMASVHPNLHGSPSCGPAPGWTSFSGKIRETSFQKPRSSEARNSASSAARPAPVPRASRPV